MSKKVLIVRGSPREKGNSASLAERVLQGAVDAGADVEDIYLHALDIQPCDSCASCKETNGVCVIGDDMQKLYPKIGEAEAIVFASPIYYFTISAQLKMFIDRWYALESDEDEPIKHKQFGVVLTYGDSDAYRSGGINAVHTFESMCHHLESEIVGVVHGTAKKWGDARDDEKLMEAAYQLGKKIGAAA